MILLCDIKDYNETIADLRHEWLIEVLLRLGLEEDHIVEPIPRETQKALALNKIEVYDSNSSDKLDIYYDGEMIAQWKDPKRIRIREKDGKEYYQVHLNFWAQIELDFGKE